MNLIKGTSYMFLIGQVKYGRIQFVHWYQWNDWYQGSDLAFHWYTIGEMHLIKGTSYIFLIGQVEYVAIPIRFTLRSFVHWYQWYNWYQWSDLALHCYTIRETHLIKGTYSIFLMDQVEYGAIPFVHWYEWYDSYQWSDLAFHWYSIGKMHLIKGT